MAQGPLDWEAVPNLAIGILLLGLASFVLLTGWRRPAWLAFGGVVLGETGFHWAVGLWRNASTADGGAYLIPVFLVARPFLHGVLFLAFMSGVRPRRGYRLALLAVAACGTLAALAYALRPASFGPPATSGMVGPLVAAVGVDFVVQACAVLWLSIEASRGRVNAAPGAAPLAALGFALVPAYVGGFAAGEWLSGFNLLDRPLITRVLAAVGLAILAPSLLIFGRARALALEARARTYCDATIVGLPLVAASGLLVALLGKGSASVALQIDRVLYLGWSMGFFLLAGAGIHLLVHRSKAAVTRFRVERELGRGSFGRAVLAQDTVLDRRVVLKQSLFRIDADRDARDRFYREARLMAKIRHANVVTLYEIREEEGVPVMVMEFVEGGSLEDLLSRRHRLGPDESLRIGLDVLAGLARIHDEGMVHRDLKPANILLDAAGTAKVADFGAAKPSKQSGLLGTLAAEGAQPGSLAYMSPEQAKGEPVDLRSDLYTVGAILWRCVAGSHYLSVKGKTEFQIRASIQTETRRVARSSVPAPVAQVLDRAMAKNPSDRYPTAREMAVALSGAARRPATGLRPRRKASFAHA